MAAVAAKPQYLGHVVHFYEHNFAREVAKYERFCANMTPIVEELKRIGLPDLTSQTYNRLIGGFHETFVDDLRELARKDSDKIGFVFKPVYGDALEKAVSALRSFLHSKYNVLQGGRELGDMPIVSGVPTVTEEFKEQLREKHTMRIRTEQGAIFYEKFLAAQALVKEMIELGFPPEAAYDWDGTDGLYIRNLEL